MTNMWKYLCYAVGFIFGSVMLFGGAFVLNFMPSLFADKIKSNLPILPGSDAYTRYTTPSVPLHVKMYFFNVTNPEEVRATGAKPVLQQLGPFSLTEKRRKNVLGFSRDNKTLDYKLIRSYYYQANESTSLDTVITLPNTPAFSAFFSAQLKASEDDNTAPVSIVSQYVGDEDLYQTYTADEWLFKGVRIKWLDSLDQAGAPIDDPPPNNTFGFYYQKNNTWDEKADGIMTISTGADGNFSDIGRVVRWNNMGTMSFWKGNECNTIRGTDGQFFHPFIQKDEKLEIFAPDLCRTLSIEFIKTTSIRSIELYRFGISSTFFKPVNYNDQTKCYCVKKSHAERQSFCKLSGVVDVSTCRSKPIVLSTPHFYNGDPLLRQAVEGMAPSASNHDTFIDIEPMTGSVLRVRRRLQVNVDMGPTQGFKASQNLKGRIIHPLIWLDQSVVIPDDLAQKLENKLTKIVRMVRILCIASIIVGPIILATTLIFICRDIRSEDKKIRGGTSGKNYSGKTKHSAGDYQKVQVILKPLGNASGGDAPTTGNGKE